MIDDDFFAKRLTALRIEKGVSEYRMSLDLGHGASYINMIANGKSLPSMGEFLYMCDYLGVTPSEFFDEKFEGQLKYKELDEIAKRLSDDDFEFLMAFAKRLDKKTCE